MQLPFFRAADEKEQKEKQKKNPPVIMRAAALCGHTGNHHVMCVPSCQRERGIRESLPSDPSASSLTFIPLVHAR
jgi:hypothetical protein